MTRCPDGVCRVKCDYIKSIGCPMDWPIICPIGNCVKNITDCVESNCPTDLPILCSD
jgi:hypothetical protein